MIEIPIVKRTEYFPTFVAALLGGESYRVDSYDRNGSRFGAANGSAADVRQTLHAKLDAWLDGQGLRRV